MNYLAHIFLSRYDENFQIGNWIADLIKYNHVQHLPLEIQQGVIHHRHIDKFADENNWFKESVNKIRHHQGKYAPVVIDICYDYLLRKNWNMFSEMPFEKFTTKFYHLLNRTKHLFPSYIEDRVDSMIHHRFLDTYEDMSGLSNVFQRVSIRASYTNNLLNAVNVIERWEAELEADFQLFFPLAIAYSNSKYQEMKAL